MRHVIVEAAHSAIRSRGPLRAFYERVRCRRGHAIAIVATARKMVCVFWHLLSRGEDYRHSIELATKKTLRKVELMAGAPHRRGGGRCEGPNREHGERSIASGRGQQRRTTDAWSQSGRSERAPRR